MRDRALTRIGERMLDGTACVSEATTLADGIRDPLKRAAINVAVKGCLIALQAANSLIERESGPSAQITPLRRGHGAVEAA